ncbi:hypothetical protein pipiens_002570 [Culex pipiens pipiens]|uniref:F-box domain-containing protein n=1 Tax=Culex pipiens pipiens TaxID=38569 RepID=A0ABD1DBU7_CULPP
MDIPAEPLFPPEVWELIFANCPFPDLKRFRLVCHRWNAIVLGCPAFRRRCQGRFCMAELRETRDPARRPLTNGNMTFRVVVVRVDNDWSEFGQYLEELFFNACVAPVGMFFRMLRCCPNLKRLKLQATGFLDGTVDNGFQLESMEEFDVACLYPKSGWTRASVIDLFGPVFPRLKIFALKWMDHFKKADQKNLIRFIQNVQGTLQSLSLEYKANLLKVLCAMNQLHLKRAALNINIVSPSWNNALWTRFCQAQQTLEELSLMEGTASNELLRVTVQNLPNLKKLCANFYGPDKIVPTFLSHLIRVEHVQICAEQVVLDLRIPLSASLKEFHLTHAEIKHGLETLTTSTTIQKLTLEKCHLEERIVTSSVHKPTNLKHLTLVECGAYPDTIDHILSGRPLLETVRLERVGSVSKESMARLLHQCPNLREMVLSKCYDFWDSVEDVMGHYYSSYGVVEGSRQVKLVIEEFTDDDEDY